MRLFSTIINQELVETSSNIIVENRRDVAFAKCHGFR